ncbi:hypothetical protein WJX77_012576 [Trebouxia sp. C0004]
MALSDKPKVLTLSTAGSLQNGTPLMKSSAADSLRAELQVLLAELKRLGLHQEHLKQDVAALDVLESGSRLPSKSANLRKNGCLISPECPGPILIVPFGRRMTYGSSDWSEATVDTPVRNVVSGGYTGFAVARDLIRMDLSPVHQDDSDADSMKGEIQAPPALPMTANLTPDQLRKAKKHRRKYGLAQPRPNSPKPKLKHPVKTSRFGLTLNRAREMLKMTTTHTAEAQKKSLQKLMTQKSHSFTVGDSPMAGSCVAPRFDYVAPDSSLVGQFTARRFDDVLVDGHTANGLPQKLTKQSVFSLAKPGMLLSPTISSSFVNVKLQEQPEERLVQKVVTHTLHTESQQLSFPGIKPRTFIRTGSLESDSNVTQDFADVCTEAESHDNQSQLRMEDMQAVTVQETTVYSHQSSKGLQLDAERAVHEPEQQAMAGSNTKVLEDMEANELLALLANLGAQQQAVLAAIAGKHQGSQRAADRRQPEAMAFPNGLSSLSISRPVVNISAAAGESAAAAQQQKSEQKPWRVPGRAIKP